LIFFWPCISLWFFVNDQLDAQFFSVCLFQFSTCFEQPCAHHQENQLYQYNLWYMSLCVGDRFLCGSERKESFCTVTYIIIPTCVQGHFMQPTFVHATELEVKGEATLSCRGNTSILLHVIFVFIVLFFRDSLVLCVFSLEFSIFLQKLNTASRRRVPEFVNNVVDSRPARILLGLRRSSSPNVRKFRPWADVHLLYCYMTHIFTGK